MKTIFIPALRKISLTQKKISEISQKLPKNIVVAYSIQYKNLAIQLKNQLSKKHNIKKLTQVLGCSKIKIPKKTQAILLISSGKFHAENLAIQTSLPIYIYNSKISKIQEKNIEKLRKQKKSSYLKFLHANNTGILISIKPGQENLEKAIQLKKQIKNKKSYLFLGDNINKQEFENFNKVQSWINTACPRICDDFRLLNFEDII